MNNYMYSLLTELFPYNRSITGDGVRKTLAKISKEIPIKSMSVPSGLKVFDWTVPNEWNVTSAKIYDSSGAVILDLIDNNLSLMSYSIAVNKTLTLEELKEHIITDRSRPNSIPYSTSYYKSAWAFCMPFNVVEQMPEDNYHVEIKSTTEPGELLYGEAFIDNGSDKTVIVSSYICHPSMANDSLSGVVLSIQLYKEIEKLESLNYNYRFLFVPETIGTICFLHRNRESIKEDTEYGLVATCVGDGGNFTYKRTRNPFSVINRVVEHVFDKRNLGSRILDFSPLGSDERQYCSPGFDMPVGVLTRSMYGQFPEYHTSDDNLEFVSEEFLQESLDLYLEIIKTYEINDVFWRTEPHCEPQMGKYDLYRPTGGAGEDLLEDIVQQRMWILNFADGETDLLSIAEKSGFDIFSLQSASISLITNRLITKENNYE